MAWEYTYNQILLFMHLRIICKISFSRHPPYINKYAVAILRRNTKLTALHEPTISKIYFYKRQSYRLSSAEFHSLPTPLFPPSRDRHCLPLNKVRWKVDSIFTFSIVLGAGKGFHSLLSLAPCGTDASSVPSTIPQLDCRAHKSMMMLWQEMSGVRARQGAGGNR